MDNIYMAFEAYFSIRGDLDFLEWVAKFVDTGNEPMKGYNDDENWFYDVIFEKVGDMFRIRQDIYRDFKNYFYEAIEPCII